MSNTLQPHGMQHIRLPCPSPAPRVYSNSCPLSLWCRPIISSSVIPFCLQSFPAPGFFLSRLFPSGSQGIGASASASVLPMNIQGWFPLGLAGWSPYSPRDSQESSLAPQLESIDSLALSLLYGPTLRSGFQGNIKLAEPPLERRHKVCCHSLRCPHLAPCKEVKLQSWKKPTDDQNSP